MQKDKKNYYKGMRYSIADRFPIVHSINSNNLGKDGWKRDGNKYYKGDDIIVYDGIKFRLNGSIIEFIEDIKK